MSSESGSTRRSEAVIVSATQSDPSPTAIPASATPTGSVSLSSFVSGEIRLTVPSPALVTDTEPSPTAMPAGAVPTRIVSTTDPSSRSRRVTVPRSGCATHRLPNPVALAPRPFVERRGELHRAVHRAHPRDRVSADAVLPVIA
jgi:hypothetical protein